MQKKKMGCKDFCKRACFSCRVEQNVKYTNIEDGKNSLLYTNEKESMKVHVG
ncbi:hypothetical protein [Chengkuizengella axinellae]|uniref:Uncharacterized protein n=1 Tax=Chengkuizengella axinellae TaxID=3064388 RepID=A0ABT9J1F2_9BACL|nr:hypothetical protein [Chengkuizengella sp. 2205SS18-9]MDP5274845.1 hypothetical protein [Chengkuizengella sp. 2205SS18-9]